MRRILALSFLICILCLSLCACSGGKIVGTWEQQKEDSVMSMVFKEDGTGSLLMDGLVVYNYTYTKSGGTVTITTQTENENVVTPYKYKANSEELILTRDNGDKIVLKVKR